MMGRRAVFAVVALLAVASLAAPVAATHDESRKLVLQLDREGDATATYRLTFNLSNETDARRFEQLSTNETARQQRLEAFGDTLAEGAAIVRNRTERNSTVRVEGVNATRLENGTGLVILRGRWTGLAATPGDAIVVTVPFSRGYRPPGRLAILGPQGYVRHTAQPPPGIARYRSAVWSADQDTGGLYMSFVPEPTPTPAVATPPAGLEPFLTAAAIALVPAVLVAVAIGVRD